MRIFKWTFYCLLIILNLLNITLLKAEDIVVSPETDSLALVEFFNALGGNNWAISWNLEEPMDTWYGIETNGPGCVIGIDLANNELIGSLPPEIGNLSKLEVLQLGANEISGSIPAEIGQLDSLRSCHLGSNQLTGEIPLEITTLPNLVYFGVNTNELSGEIPPEIGNLTKLKTLHLAQNNFTGNLPAEIGNLVNLEVLRLYANNLEGELPAQIGNLTVLDSLFAQNNQFSGSIPTTIGDMVNLKTCFLFGNEFTGNIPSEIGNLNLLKKLELHNNNLSGLIPTTISNNNLIRIRLDNNALEGEIPVEFSNLTGLQHLNLSNNLLTGSLPLFFTELAPLQELFLNDNLFVGCFPPEYNFFCDRNVNFANNPSLANNGNFPEFCATGLGGCTNLTNVYPGDANYDGEVNLLDVFTLAYKNQTSGSARSTIDIEWTSTPSIDWVNTAPDGIDAQHADCDGDGEVDIFLDMDAVTINFDSTHTESTATPIPFALDRLRLRLLSTALINNIYELNFELVYQNLDGEEGNVYGLAFKLNYDALAEFNTLNLAQTTLGNDLYTFSHDNMNENSTEVALVKTNGINSNNELSTLADFIIFEENIPSAGEGVQLSLSDVLITDNAGNVVRALESSSEVFVMSVANTNMDMYNILSMDIDTITSTCNGGIAKANPVGGTPPYSYVWSNEQTEATATGLLLGSQMVTITDATNQQVIGQAEITGTPIIQTDYSFSENGDEAQTVTLSLSGGSGDLTVEWENGETGNSAVVNNNLLLSGDYTVTITDETGCSRTETIVLEGTTAIDNQALYRPQIACSVYPNPTTDYLNISLTNLPPRLPFQLVLVNELGQVINVKELEAPAENAQVSLKKDVQMLPVGTYFLQLQREGQTVLSEVFIKD